MEKTQKSKLFLFSFLFILIALLVIFVAAINKPQQLQSKAQVSSTDQCVIDGGFVTDQASCAGPERQIINTIENTAGGDVSTIQVCCRATTAPPMATLSCPSDSLKTPENECPVDRRVSPIVSGGGDGGDGIHVAPGFVCCRPQVPVATDTPVPPQNTPTAATPTPSACLLPNAPEISNLQITCPEGCSGGAIPQ